MGSIPPPRKWVQETPFSPGPRSPSLPLTTGLPRCPRSPGGLASSHPSLSGHLAVCRAAPHTLPGSGRLSPLTLRPSTEALSYRFLQEGQVPTSVQAGTGRLSPTFSHDGSSSGRRWRPLQTSTALTNGRFPVSRVKPHWESPPPPPGVLGHGPWTRRLSSAAGSPPRCPSEVWPRPSPAQVCFTLFHREALRPQLPSGTGELEVGACCLLFLPPWSSRFNYPLSTLAWQRPCPDGQSGLTPRTLVPGRLADGPEADAATRARVPAWLWAAGGSEQNPAEGSSEKPGVSPPWSSLLSTTVGGT